MTGSGKIFALLTLLLLGQAALSQAQRTEHTFKLDDTENRPAATLDDVSWMVGNWSGEAFGNTFEQGWNPPSAGSMIGFFKLMDGDEVVFYELLLLVEEEGSLSLKVKHFNADFTAWEDKADYVDFRFVKSEENAVHFSGISFYRIDDDTMHGYVVFRNGDDVREEQLVYRRN
jgi:hypothetical protein